MTQNLPKKDLTEAQHTTRDTTTKGERTYGGGCFCGAVQLRLTGHPVEMGYCHCTSCRHWSAGPVNAFMLWKPEALTVTRGLDQLGSFNKTERSHRKWCRACGGHLFTEHPQWGLIDVYASIVPEFPFTPGVHVNYAERVLRVTDGLPKLRDIPQALGGSGVAIPE
jgi:hypothetical protein